MKTTLIRLCIVIFALLAISSAWAGNEGPSGGDEVGIEFEAAYITALNDIRLHYPDLQVAMKQTDVLSIARSARVIVIDEPVKIRVGDHLQDSIAMNDKTLNLIVVSRPRWVAVGDRETKAAIALHEVLSLAGLEDTGVYSISGDYLSRITMNPQSSNPIP